MLGGVRTSRLPTPISMYLGLDLGTSAVKAVLVDDTQSVVASATAPLSTSRPFAGASEQAPEDWWRAAVETCARLRQAAPAAWTSVKAVGLSGQMHGAVLLDAQGEVLRPAILWNDGRSVAQCRMLERAVPALAHVAGVHAMPGFTAPKLLWVREHEPDVFARIATVLLPKDHLRFRMTGVRVTDASDAAGTLWFDQAARTWSLPLVAASGLTPDQLPPVIEGTEPSATLRDDIADGLGLPRGIPVAGGGGDAAAGAVGIGAVEEGDAFVSLGTSGQVFTVTAWYDSDPAGVVHAFAHCVPGRWYRMGALLNGASCLAWVARLVGAVDLPALLDRVEAQTDASGSLLFLPYLTGERTPHDNADARGVFFGLDSETTPERLVRAVLEGVAFAVAEAAECLAKDEPLAEMLGVIGGGSKSRLWLRILASVLDRPLVRYAASDIGPAYGAARLARACVSRESVRETCGEPAAIDVVMPDPEWVERYRARGPRFRRLYRTLAAEFRAGD